MLPPPFDGASVRRKQDSPYSGTCQSYKCHPDSVEIYWEPIGFHSRNPTPLRFASLRFASLHCMGLPPRNPLSVADHHRNYGQTASAMADNRQKGENRQRPNDAISEACSLIVICSSSKRKKIGTRPSKFTDNQLRFPESPSR